MLINSCSERHQVAKLIARGAQEGELCCGQRILEQIWLFDERRRDVGMAILRPRKNGSDNPDFETSPSDEAGVIHQKGSSPDPDGVCKIGTLTPLPLSRGILRIVISTRAGLNPLQTT